MLHSINAALSRKKKRCYSVFLLQLTHQGWKCCTSYWNKPIWPEALGDCGEETIWVIKQSSGLSPREKRGTLWPFWSRFLAKVLHWHKTRTHPLLFIRHFQLNSPPLEHNELRWTSGQWKHTHTNSHTHTKAQNAGLTPPNTDKPTSLTQSLNTAACPLHQNQ